MSKLTGMNLFAATASQSSRYSINESSKSSQSLNTGIDARMSVVNSSIHNRLSNIVSTGRYLRNNAVDHHAKLTIMREGAFKLKNSLSEMRAAIMSAAGKDAKLVKNIEETIETDIEVFNTTLEQTKFGKRFLIGAEHFEDKMRTGKGIEDEFQLNIKAINPIFGKRKAEKMFDVASEAPAVKTIRQMRAMGFGDMLAVSKAIAYVAANNVNVVKAAEDITDLIDKIAAGGDVSARGGTIGTSVKNALAPYIGNLNPGGNNPVLGTPNAAITPSNNGRVDLCYIAVDAAAHALGLPENDHTAVNKAIIYGSALDASHDPADVVQNTFNLISARIRNYIPASANVEAMGGYVGEQVLAFDHTLPVYNGGDAEQKRLEITNYLLDTANAAAIKEALKQAAERVVHEVFGNDNRALSDAIFEATDVVSKIGGTDVTGPKTSATAIKDAIFMYREGKGDDIGRVIPSLDSPDKVGNFNGYIDTIIKSGPKGIETTIIAVAASHAAANSLGKNAASDGVNQFKLGDGSDLQLLRTTERDLVELERQIEDRLTAISSQLKAVEAFTESIDNKINLVQETSDAISKTNIVEEAQRFADQASTLQVTFNVLNAGAILSDEAINNVRDALESA